LNNPWTQTFLLNHFMGVQAASHLSTCVSRSLRSVWMGRRSVRSCFVRWDRNLRRDYAYRDTSVSGRYMKTSSSADWQDKYYSCFSGTSRTRKLASSSWTEICITHRPSSVILRSWYFFMLTSRCGSFRFALISTHLNFQLWTVREATLSLTLAACMYHGFVIEETQSKSYARGIERIAVSGH
jgi:hypothetical protein